MLLIARKVGESVQIGSDIEVKIIRTGRSRVLIAIEAPRALKILRVDSDAADQAQQALPETMQRAANETIRQRRAKLATR